MSQSLQGFARQDQCHSVLYAYYAESLTYTDTGRAVSWGQRTLVLLLQPRLSIATHMRLSPKQLPPVL